MFMFMSTNQPKGLCPTSHVCFFIMFRCGINDLQEQRRHLATSSLGRPGVDITVDILDSLARLKTEELLF